MSAALLRSARSAARDIKLPSKIKSENILSLPVAMVEERLTRRAQSQFSGKEFVRPKQSFGGSLLKGSNPKIKRPLESKLPIFLTLKANKGVLRLPKNFCRVERILENTNRKHGVRMYRHANVGNHLHLVIKIPARSRWSAYIRELTGRIAFQLKDFRGAEFWKHRPHTRIVGSWQKAFRTVLAYVDLNILEADGMISRKEIKNLKDLRAIFADSA